MSNTRIHNPFEGLTINEHGWISKLDKKGQHMSGIKELELKRAYELALKCDKVLEMACGVDNPQLADRLVDNAGRFEAQANEILKRYA